jgi:hypothetical protein
VTLYPPIPDVRVVAVTGAARNGKDTFAMALLRQVPGAERWAFSDLLAAHERLAGRMSQRNAIHLQSLHGKIDRKLLLMAMYEAIRDHCPPLAIITGIRKPDEAAMVKDMGGTIVRVIRRLPTGKAYRASDRDLNHPVEQDIDAIVVDATFEADSVQKLIGYAVAFQSDMLT